MSLEKLLEDADGADRWGRERVKLIRLAIGLIVAAVTALAGTALVLSRRGQRAPVAIAAGLGDVESLTRLLRVRREAADLRRGAGARTPINRAEGLPVARGSAFARARRTLINFDPGDGFTRLETIKEDLYIPTGAVFQARLLTPIKTSVERTFVMAETTTEFRMDLKRRLAKGTRLIGTSRLNPVLKGVIVEFNTLVSPAGLETSVSGLALSRNALPELEGLFFSDKLMNHGVALAFGFLSGFADAARTRDVTLLGSAPQISPSNEVLTGFSTASFQVANEILRDIRSTSIEYVVVPAGEQVFVVLTKRYELNSGGPNGTLAK